MMRNVYLHGFLKEQFGEVFRFDICSVQQAGRALDVNLKGFRKAIMDKYFRIIVGDINSGTELGEDELNFRLGKTKDIHIVPLIAGNKSGGAKAVIGIAIIGIAIVASGGTLAAPLAGLGSTAFTVGGAAVTFGNIATFGVLLAVGGISQMLAGSPKVQEYQSRESPEKRASFLFNGATNTTEQGQPVPIVYGRMRTGSVVVSLGLSAEQI